MLAIIPGDGALRNRDYREASCRDCHTRCPFAVGKLRAAQQKVQGPGSREHGENWQDLMQFPDESR
jgi:hypothetical protein